jgi:hypothetical protein
MAPNKDSIEIKTIDEIHSEDFKLRPPSLASLSHLDHGLGTHIGALEPGGGGRKCY